MLVLVDMLPARSLLIIVIIHGHFALLRLQMMCILRLRHSLFTLGTNCFQMPTTAEDR